MFSLTSREKMWIVLAALALVFGAGIRHWRDVRISRDLAQQSPATAAVSAAR